LRMGPTLHFRPAHSTGIALVYALYNTVTRTSKRKYYVVS